MPDHRFGRIRDDSTERIRHRIKHHRLVVEAEPNQTKPVRDRQFPMRLLVLAEHEQGTIGGDMLEAAGHAEACE